LGDCSPATVAASSLVFLSTFALSAFCLLSLCSM
jgi:hypothetical protein